MIYICCRSGCWEEVGGHLVALATDLGVGFVLAWEIRGELGATTQQNENGSTSLFIQYLRK